MNAVRTPRRNCLPPYANRFIDSCKRGSVFVYTGSGAWAAAKDDCRRQGAGRFPYRFPLVCPVKERPHDFDWYVVSGRDVVLIEYGGSPDGYLHELAETLVYAGANPVVVIPDQSPTRSGEYIVYRASRSLA